MNLNYCKILVRSFTNMLNSGLQIWKKITRQEWHKLKKHSLISKNSRTYLNRKYFIFTRFHMLSPLFPILLSFFFPIFQSVHFPPHVFTMYDFWSSLHDTDKCTLAEKPQEWKYTNHIKCKYICNIVTA